MPINRAPFDALIDDDGSGTTGTPWNKTQIKDVILDPADAAYPDLNAVNQDIVFTADRTIRRNTADGADSGSLAFTGGGSGEATRGGQVAVFGNEAPGGRGGKVWAFIGTGGAFEVVLPTSVVALAIDGPTGVVSVPLGQVRFPTTANPSTDAYTQDDYRELPWVPVDASGAGLVVAGTGFYVKKGGEVTAWGYVTYPATASGASAKIGGLPFLANNPGTYQYGAFISYSTYALGFAGLLGADSAINWFKVGGTPLLNSDLTGKDVRFTCSYCAVS